MKKKFWLTNAALGCLFLTLLSTYSFLQADPPMLICGCSCPVEKHEKFLQESAKELTPHIIYFVTELVPCPKENIESCPEKDCDVKVEGLNVDTGQEISYVEILKCEVTYNDR